MNKHNMDEIRFAYVIPKDVSVAWMPEIKAFEIKINKDTMLEKESGNLLLEKLFNELDDIVECNEINPTTDSWFAYENNIYILTSKDYVELKETGKTIMSYVGTIKDNVDLEIESDRDFILWYYNADTIEEAVEYMNKTL